jgi:hypothetical protein
MNVLDWGPEHHRGMSNHLPMAVQALQTLRATELQMANFIEITSSKLEALPAPVQHFTQWQQVAQVKGQSSHFYEVRGFFLDQLQGLSNAQLLHKYLAQVIPGISGGAFHPIIRLAHALGDANTPIEDAHQFELASGLAYWVFAYLELHWPNHQHLSSHSLAETITHIIDNNDWPEERLGKRTVVNDLMQVHQQANFDALVFRPQASNIELQEIESAILNLLLSTNDFAVLHGVTATYAMRQVLPFCSAPAEALSYLWQGLVSAFLCRGFNPQQLQTNTTALKNIEVYQPEEIRQRACNSLDEHSIKLAAVCLDMYQRTDNQDYLLAASRKLQEDKSATLN